MVRKLSLLAALSAMAASSAIAQSAQDAGERWYKTIEAFAGDDTQGRLTGTPGYDKAAAYVAEQFRALGLKPAGTDGFFQPVSLTEQFFNTGQTRIAIVRGPARKELNAPHDLFVRVRSSVPAKVDAPMVFAGYGLSLPELGHDDFKGIDVRGKVVVVFNGSPAGIPSLAKSTAQSERSGLLASRGAAGLIILNTPHTVDFPWPRQEIVAASPSMYLTDARLRDQHEAMLIGFTNPDSSQVYFDGAAHSFAELAALCEGSKPLPVFALPGRFVSTVKPEIRTFTSPNILALLPGSDPTLKAETVAVTAHLDAHGIGFPIDGDEIYNGVNDNAVGVASVIEMARKMIADGARPKRSILFAIVTAEEKGHMGSRYLVQQPPAAAGRMIADVNIDMPLPIIPFARVTLSGSDESSLGPVAIRVAQSMGLEVVPDPHPESDFFRRSDQYSFVRFGTPAIVGAFGAVRGSPDDAVQSKWKADHYHSPSDDLTTPLLKADAARYNDFMTRVTLAIANDPAVPTWNKESFFRTFKRP